MAGKDQIVIQTPRPGEAIELNGSAAGTVTLADPSDVTPPTISAKILLNDGTTLEGSSSQGQPSIAILKPDWGWSFNFTTPAGPVGRLIVQTQSENKSKIAQFLPGSGGGPGPVINSPLSGANVQSPFSAYGTASGCGQLTATLSAGGVNYQGTLAVGCPNWQFNFPGVSGNLTNPVLTVCCDGACTQETLGTVYASGGGGGGGPRGD